MSTSLKRQGSKSEEARVRDAVAEMQRSWGKSENDAEWLVRRILAAADRPEWPTAASREAFRIGMSWGSVYGYTVDALRNAMLADPVMKAALHSAHSVSASGPCSPNSQRAAQALVVAVQEAGL